MGKIWSTPSLAARCLAAEWHSLTSDTHWVSTVTAIHSDICDHIRAGAPEYGSIQKPGVTSKSLTLASLFYRRENRGPERERDLSQSPSSGPLCVCMCV